VSPAAIPTLVARIQKHGKRHPNRTEGAWSHGNIIGLKRQTEFTLKRHSDYIARRLFACLISKPINTLWFDASFQCLYNLPYRHFVRVAKGEISPNMAFVRAVLVVAKEIGDRVKFVFGVTGAI
jgi:hypothetical protein